MVDNKIWIGIIVAAIVVVAIYLVYNSGPVVSGQGFSSITATPDEVSVNVNVETRDKTAQLAQDKNQEISDNLLFELVKLGYDRDELKFVNQYVYPEYDWNSGRQTLKGYVVSQQLVVKTKEVTKAPSIVDAVINSGALVSYINFGISDEMQSEYKNQALEEASKDARKKAESIAAGQGKKLGNLISLSNQDYSYPGPLNYYSRDSAMSVVESNAGAVKAVTNLAPNDQEITASVTAQYRVRLI